MEESPFKIEEVKKVYTPDSIIEVDCGNGPVKFAFPLFGPGHYYNCARNVISEGLALPTGENIAFILDAAFRVKDTDFDSDEAESFREIISHKGLWVPNVNLWIPKNMNNSGIYRVFDNQGIGEYHDMVYTDNILDYKRNPYKVGQLEERLIGGKIEGKVRFSQDKRVAFAPFSREPESYKEDNYMACVANFGVTGTEKLLNLAKRQGSNLKLDPVRHFNDEPVERTGVIISNSNNVLALRFELGISGAHWSDEPYMLGEII